ncbi:uncharacterized protein LOC119689193 isoform X1 [Teleopsis dalmanni]|uniref:uncharacterized protein LOC119663516 isoform X1 n=1 Tax=Teleopsis dalmanni TaxID=139649 RepID=UPI0018CF046D|nr:uncharacterized protein LOC119663516 isoform X1 [Teleopsis dalmanni]XP_037929054.1 uncharacterized protein LOC119663518 isoform X1 [Teleopsis dalmanni]XP_037959892.1 uncharacterized protein LOC119689193 isoform X1 [Teleopsis dalmanni]
MATFTSGKSTLTDIEPDQAHRTTGATDANADDYYFQSIPENFNDNSTLPLQKYMSVITFQREFNFQETRTKIFNLLEGNADKSKAKGDIVQKMVENFENKIRTGVEKQLHVKEENGYEKPPINHENDTMSIVGHRSISKETITGPDADNVINASHSGDQVSHVTVQSYPVSKL